MLIALITIAASVAAAAVVTDRRRHASAGPAHVDAPVAHWLQDRHAPRVS